MTQKPSYEELEKRINELEKEALIGNRAEEVLIDEARLRSLLKISQLKTASLRELLDHALNEAIALSGSKLGYIYYYNEERCEFTLHAWSKEVMKECTIPSPPTVYQLEKTGIWGEAVRQRKPIVVNDFLAPNPLKKGCPEGHAQLFRYLTVPVFSDDRIVAVVGVANKGTDYTGLDVRQLALMMDSVWKIAERKEAEEALRASETKYRIVSDNNYDWEYWMSPEGRFLYTSPSCQRITGHAASEFETDPKLFIQIIHPDDLAQVTEHLAPAQFSGGPCEMEFRIIHADGATRWIGHACQPVYDAEGRFLGCRGSNRDITKRKQAEEALRESRHMLHSVLDTIPVRVFWKDLDSNYLGCNHPFALDAGLQSPEEIVGRNDFEMGWAEQAQLYISDDRMVAETGRPKLGYEEPQTTPDGDRIWLRTSKVPLFDVEGKIKGVLGTYEDITVHKRAEEALQKAHDELERRVEERTAELTKVNEALQCEILEHSRVEEEIGQSEEKYRQLFETVSDAILVFDAETRRFIDINERAVCLYGYSRDEFLTLKQTDLTAEVDLSDASIEETLAGERTKVPLRYHRGKNGTVFPVEISGSTFVLGGRRLLCGIVRDITERRRAEEELSAYRYHLEDLVKERTAELGKTNEQLTLEIEERGRAEEALKLFAYSVAHDLKSPAVGIYGLTKRLNKIYRDALDEKGRSYCDQILKVSEHIAALVEKINIYIMTKEARPLFEKTNVKEILRMLKDEFSAQLSIRQIEWFEPDPDVEMKVDRLSILRVFRNLVDNALKYGGERLSKIWIGHEETADFHIFSVTDNGRGLKGADSEKIFGLFQRYETSRGVEGAGLGLTIVKEIARQHGGQVWVEPAAKKGTAFCISFSKNL